MSNKISLLIIPILFLIFSCKKDEFPIPDYYFGNASALKDGVQWDAKPYASRLENGDVKVNFNVISTKTGFSETLQASWFLSKEGKYTFKDTTKMSIFWSETSSDGDAISNWHANIAGTDNFLTIDKFDEKKKTLSGTFQLAAKDDNGHVIKFTNGKYNTKITF